MKKIAPALFAVYCIILLLIFLISCSKDVAKPAEPAQPAPPASTGTNTITPADPCDTVTYAQTIRPIVTKICQRCHGDVNPSAGFSLNSYALLKAKADNGKLAARVIRGEGGFMPQGRAMASDTLSLFNCWLKNGCKP